MLSELRKKNSQIKPHYNKIRRENERKMLYMSFFVCFNKAGQGSGNQNGTDFLTAGGSTR